MPLLTPVQSTPPAPVKAPVSPKKELSKPRRSASMGFSSQSLVAVDLARDKNRPLHVPPMLSTRPGTNTLDSLTIAARKVGPGILLDEAGQYYAMSKVLAHGTFGNIRLGLKYDPVISQVWIFKEIASESPSRTQSFTSLAPTPARVNRLSLPALPSIASHYTATPFIAQGPEEALAFEVNLMHRAHSPLAPHAVLRTSDKAIMMMPLADTDLHNVWTTMYQWAPQKRRPIVLAVARQLLAELNTLHESGAAHRDIKPNNIFLTREGATFLGDYGMALPLGQLDVNVGTYNYLAPEVMYDTRHDKQKSDIFSAGAVLTSLLVNTGFFWKDLWQKDALVEGLRSTPMKPGSSEQFVKIVQSYKEAFARKAQAGADRNLKTMPKQMHKQLVNLRAAFPEMFSLLKQMQDPNPAMRPTAKQAMDRCNAGALAPTDTDGAELRSLLATSNRPIRAAADKEALMLEAKVRDFMATRSRSRRNSLDSIRRFSAIL